MGDCVPPGDSERPGELYRRAGLLFDRLCELAPDNREEALARAAGQDPQAAGLARRMLERDATPGPLAFVADSNSGDEDASEHDPAGVLGTMVGAYQVEALLGRGGMGAVYLGRRTEPEARVAIKFITLSAAPAAALERFKSEARLLARIEHPGVVRYRDSGVDPRGRLYIAMDFVDGEPLQGSLPEIAASVERTVAVVVAIAEAVHHLHQRRVLHRDLKPSNVLVRREGRALVPIVIDLGIARALADSEAPHGTDALALTGTFGLGPVGTPAFMSPEQARVGGLPDVRTDVHALGAVLYALLTGHPPRELDQLETRDPLEFHRRLRETEARAPSQAVDAALFDQEGARRRARRIDRDLDAIVLKSVALNPNDRYGSAEAFAADLLRWSGGLPVSARLVGPVGRVRRFARRRPIETLLASLAAVILLGAVIAIASSRSAEIEAGRRYEEQFEISRELNRFLTEDVLLRAAPELDGPQVPAIDLLRAAAESSAKRVERKPVVAVSTGGTLMEVFERIGASAEADAELARVAPYAHALALENPRRLIFETQRAALHAGRSQWAQAEQGYRVVLDTLDRLPDPFPEIEARAADGLGYVLIETGELDAAEIHLTRALHLFDTSLASKTSQAPGGRLGVLGSLAMLSWSRGDLDTAAREYEELLVAIEEQFGAGTAHAFESHANLVGVHLGRRRPNEALPHARKAVALADTIYEASHPNRLVALNQLASCLSSAGSFEEAIDLRREVYAGRLERFGPDNSAVGVALNNLASTMVRAGRGAEARDLARTALDTLVETLGEANPTTANAYLTLAVIEDGAGNIDHSQQLFDAAVAVYERSEGDHMQAIEQARAAQASYADKH